MSLEGDGLAQKEGHNFRNVFVPAHLEMIDPGDLSKDIACYSGNNDPHNNGNRCNRKNLRTKFCYRLVPVLARGKPHLRSLACVSDAEATVTNMTFAQYNT